MDSILAKLNGVTKLSSVMIVFYVTINKSIHIDMNMINMLTKSERKKNGENFQRTATATKLNLLQIQIAVFKLCISILFR